MITILFICHGNICRSPMAECIMAELIAQQGLSEKISVDSCATSTEEIGNPIYPPIRKTLFSHQVPLIDHTARQIELSDLSADYLVCMDANNIRNLNRMFPRAECPFIRLMEYAGNNADVSDPWYSRDFETAYEDITIGCAALLETIKNEQGFIH